MAFPNGVSLRFSNYQATWDKLNPKPVVINKVVNEYPATKAGDMINDLIRIHYASDQLDTLPKCECGLTTGAFNNVVCKYCGTEVRRAIDRPTVSQIWITAPAGVPALINPTFWSLFTSEMSSSKVDLLTWLTDPTYVPLNPNDEATKAIVGYLEDNNVPRGYAEFYYNFDKIMDIVVQPLPILKHRTGKNAGRNIRDIAVSKMRRIIAKYRDCIFSTHVPFPSRAVFPSEQLGFTTQVDPAMPLAFDAVKTICAIETSAMRMSPRRVNSLVVKFTKLYKDYHVEFRKNTCGGKTGIARRQLGSTRSQWTARAVIAPLACAHQYDEVHMPWSVSVGLLRVDIASVLLNEYKMSPKKIYKYIDNATLRYDSLIHEVINKLIAQCPEGGIPLSILRNPTLARGSNQYFRMTKVITNVEVRAMLLSVLVIKAPNADFDGDQMQIKLLRDNKERKLFRRLMSHLGIIDTSRPRRVKGIITHHPEVIAMANNFLRYYRSK